MNHNKRLFLFFASAVLMLLLASGQNCDGTSKDLLGSKITKLASSRNTTTTGSTTGTGTGNGTGLDPGPEPTDLGGIIDPNCKTNAKYNACIFKKNPVAQNGASIPGGLAPGTNLDSYVQFAVNLTGLDASGFLQNSYIRVAPDQSRQRVKAVNNNWKFSFVGDRDRKVGQVMAYYWLNYQKEYCEKEAGGFYVNRPVSVLTTYNQWGENAQWDPSIKEISMGLTSKNEYALAADIYLHEMGHGNLDFASAKAGNSIDGPDSTEGGCGNNWCCKTTAGCISAINEGQADFHSSMIFFEKPATGESIVNSTEGLADCGLVRNPLRNRTLSINSTYNNSCGIKGEIHFMGYIFNAIWYEVRRSAGANAKEVDRLFIAFLPTLQSTDTYKTILNKIKATDQQMFQGKYSQAFATEFAAHGI